MSKYNVGLVAAGLVLSWVGLAWAQDAANTPGVVCNVKVLSDKVPDMSSLEAWKASCIKDRMSDKDKALAIWKTVVSFQHQNMPPAEFLHNEDTVLDTVKLWNVYGYSFCGVASSQVQTLARYVGLKARGWTLKGHVVSEVMWDNKWHLLDASLINYFTKDDGDIASVEEIVAAIQEWYKAHPELTSKDAKGDTAGDDAKLRKFQAEEGWTGWKKGPALLANCKFYDAGGWWPAKTHGWYATMQEYDGFPIGTQKFPWLYQSGYTMSYRLNVQLRDGEKLTRNWFNKGLQINDGAPAGPLKKDARFEAYCAEYGDLNDGRVGNGLLEYTVGLGKAEASAWKFDNLVAEGDKLRVKDDSKQGVLEIRMPVPYVILTGELKMTAAIGGDGNVGVYFSDNNGLDWKEVTKVDKAGEQTVDLKDFARRRYTYLLRFVMKGKGTGLDALSLRHDIQHSQRPLPTLTQGDNTITFSAGPQESTVTLEGKGIGPKDPKNLHILDFHPTLDNIDEKSVRVAGGGPGTGSITFNVSTPGDMTRLRIGEFYRTWSDKDGWDIQVSFDAGKTFKTVLEAGAAPDRFEHRYVEVTEIPPGTKIAQVKYVGTQKSTLSSLIQWHVNADYKAPNAGFRPVKVTYLWEEGGIEKKDEHVAAKPQDTWKIKCEGKPAMKSLIVELAGK